MQELREPRPPPDWARRIDLVMLALLATAAYAALTGGVRIRVGFLRLSLTSPARLLLIAALVAVFRHVLAPAVPVYRDLPRRIAALAQSIFVDDLDARSMQPLTARFVVAVTALFTVLAAAMTYPLIRHMRDSLNDPGDPLLNLWTLRWVAHQIVVSPRYLFDANIFAPERNTLAYSETLLAPALLAAPLSWLGAGAILVHNVVFLGGFVASGVGAALLVRALTGYTPAAVIAGIVFAFAPFRFDHFAQLQLQQAQWIPFAFLALHRLIASGRVRDGVWLGIAVAAQLLSCMYYGIFLGLYLAVVGGWLLAWRMRVYRRWLPAIGASVLTAVVVFAPAANAYLGARAVVGERGRQENRSFSATWTNYAAAPDVNWLYGRTAQPLGGLERDLFPGVVAVGLSAAAVWPPVSAVRAGYAIGLLFAVDLTRGFNGLIYPALYALVPPVRALRIPALAVVLVAFSLAVLAGYGAARVRRRGVIATLACAVLAESLSIPMPLRTFPASPPPVYADIARDNPDDGTIVELPMIYSADPRFQDQIYMYYSTFHWQKLVNGYSGFFPPSYLEAAAILRTFPDNRSLEALAARHTRYVVIHGERMGAEEYQRIVGAVDTCGCGLTLVARRPWQGKEISVYRTAALAAAR